MNHIKIDLERIVSDIDRNIFGGYMEIACSHRDTEFSYLDIGDNADADKSRLPFKVRNALERMNLATIRFPGGNFASGYRWEDGVGPRHERPIRHDLAHNPPRIVPNHYGTNEFIRFCRSMNIEPYLCVNCGDGNMREAADWVEYCNGTGDTELVNLRRKHGFKDPHKVKYWGIGNEVDGPWQLGYKTPQEYARAVTEFSKVMKRVDPNINLVASAVSLWEDHPLSQFPDQHSRWVERTQLILEQAGDIVDYLAIHRYAHPSENEPFETYMAFAESFNERLNAYEGLIRAVSLERGIKHSINIAVDEWDGTRIPEDNSKDDPIKLAADEWGVMHLPEGKKDVPYNIKLKVSLEDALATAQCLNTFIRHAHSVRMANFTPMPTRGMINYDRPDKPVLLKTIFFPFELYSRTCGQLALDVFWYGDTFSGTYKNRAYKGMRTLDVAATLDKNRKQLVMYVVNQSKEKAMETNISLTSGQFTGIVQVCVINGPDVKAENTDEKPNEVGERETVINVSGKSFIYLFEPHSVTALVCQVK